MPDPFVIGVVVGVTPDRWVRVWQERMHDVPLRIDAVEDPATALGAGARMVFARLPVAGIEAADLHVIPLWEEAPVVVAAKDHPVKLFDAVTLADLEQEELYPGWDDAVLDIVAAGHGIARMPQSVFRASGRRDVVARPISDADPTRIALVWLRTAEDELIDEFIGIVRGRTANSSRGAQAEMQEERPARPERPAKAAPRTDRRPRRPPERRSKGGKRR